MINTTSFKSESKIKIDTELFRDTVDHLWYLEHLFYQIFFSYNAVYSPSLHTTTNMYDPFPSDTKAPDIIYFSHNSNIQPLPINKLIFSSRLIS